MGNQLDSTFIKKVRYRLNKLTRWLLEKILILDKGSELQRGTFGIVPKDQQPSVEFAITKLSLLIGFLLAFCFHADLFKIISSDEPHKILGWGDSITTLKNCLWNFLIKWESTDLPILGKLIWPGIETFFGCLATGFLLTFGSKFFHDLLEILYEVKRAKRNLEDERIYKSPDFQALVERLKSPYGDPVSVVLERHKDILLTKFPSVISIERSINQFGESVLEIFTIDETDLKALESYRFDYSDRNAEKVLPKSQIRFKPFYKPVEVQETIKLFIGNQTGPTNKTPFHTNYGTLGFFALRQSNNAKIFVTCAHVIDVNPANIHTDGSTTIWAENDLSERVTVGVLTDYKLNSWMDAAIIELNAEVDAINFDPDKSKFLKSYRELAWDEKSDVWTNGGTSIHPRHGTVVSHQNAVQIKYGAQKRTIYNLLKIRSPEGKSVSDKGDSGSLVFDLDMNAVGMIIAGNENGSYAIPLQRVLTDMEIKLPINI
ncbi:MAG: hypothetical protein JNN28_08480 [Saprospiraceae bacterium]|nr:hypothetical protein [Saprospiraceae bacterium]